MPRQTMTKCQNAINAGNIHANSLHAGSGNSYVFNVFSGASFKVYLGNNNTVTINKENLGNVRVQKKETTDKDGEGIAESAEQTSENNVVCRAFVAHDAFGKIIKEGHDIAIWENDVADKRHSCFVGCGVYVGKGQLMACLDVNPVVVKIEMNTTEHKYHNCQTLGSSLSVHKLRNLAERAVGKEGKRYKNSTRFINDVHGHNVC